MPRREEALAAMRDALQIQDPEWDIVPGTAEYKVLEAVAQQIENITFNSVLNDYHFDVDKKTGLELDLFMSLFGFARIKAKRATGSITFSRGTDAAQDYVIPLGTQCLVVATDFSPSFYFQTTISAVLPYGATEVSVPAQAVIAGTIGNVSSGAITGLASSVGGITGVLNAQAFSGGRDAESDDDLKARWRRTVFRNISGTEDQFLAVAFNESAYVTRANLVGPIERYLEQVQLTAPYDLTTSSPWTAGISSGGVTTTLGLTATQGDRFPVALLADPDTWYYAGIFNAGVFVEIVQVTNRAAGSDSLTVVRAGTPVSGNGKTLRVVFPSSVPDSKYTFPPGGEVVGLNTSLTSQQLGVPSPDAGTTGDYYLITFDGVTSTANIPSGSTLPFIYVTTTGATTFGLDSVIEVEHEYTPTSSRNDLSDAGCKTADKVDVFMDGVDPVTVTEQFPMPTHANIKFGTAFTESEFIRDDGVDEPATGDLYTPLSKAPISTLPSTISVAASNTQAALTYYKDEDYWLVSNNDDPAGLEGSPRSSNGIEWKSPLSVTDNAAYAAGVFSATIQVTSSGKLSGWYAYVVTYEVDGIETISITDTPEAASAINDATHTKNDLVIPLYVPGPAHSTIWRKIYRSKSSATSAAALEGPFYLLAVIKNNVTAAYVDNKADDALAPIQPPKAPPEAGSLVSFDYNYNRLIERVDAQMDQVRLVGMDVLSHSADEVQLKFNLGVVLFPGGGTPGDVESDLNTILTAWINRKSFRNNIQIADLIEQAGQASGVDNIRLVRAGEERNEAQVVTATTTRATPDPTLDTFKITIGTDVSGAIAYNETAVVAREILEAMPNIHEGNTFATQLFGAIITSDTNIQVDDNAGLHLDSDIANVNSVVGGTAGWGSPGLYIQVEEEIMLLTAAVDAGGTQTWTVKRAQLRTTAANHADNTDVHIIGDVAVSYSASGVDHSYTIYFLPNLYTQVNDWGSRKVDLLTAAKTADTSKLTLAVARRAQGVGSGIQVIADNDQTIMNTYYDDFYLDSDELPSIAGVDVLLRAQNTF